ncbi:MAG: hypothetical protein NXY57DRAFT_877154, partial [Lentinula lateritia]
KTQTIEEASGLYFLSDFHGACSDLIDRIKSEMKILTIGGRRTGNMQSPLPFYRVKLWSRLRIQSRTDFNLDLFTDPHTIFSAPPGPGWEFGRQNAVIINVDQSFQWPRSSLEGHAIVLVKMIFTVAQPRRPSLPIEGTHRFLAYCECLDIVNQPPPPPQACPFRYPDYSTGCYVLKRARRADGTPMGDIIPVSQFRSFADICPLYRGNSHPSLLKSTSQYHSDEFLLNKYFNKETFFAL